VQTEQNAKFYLSIFEVPPIFAEGGSVQTLSSLMAKIAFIGHISKQK